MSEDSLEELEDILACPKCHGPVVRREGRYVCEACRLAFPIRDGIPDFLLEDALPLETPAEPGQG